MAGSSNLRLYRSLLKELKLVYGKGKFQDAPAFHYVRDQFRRHELTSEKHCRSSAELQHTAETYVCYLRSAREHRALAAVYKGKGDVDIRTAAHLVGLELPKPQPQ